MKYKDRDALVSSLRELADFIEDKGIELPVEPGISVTMHAPYYKRPGFTEYTPQEKKAITKKIVRLLKPVKKEYNSYELGVTRKFGEKITLRYSVPRAVVCKAVKTGNKIIHAASYVPERVEEEVEWVCTDPLLKADS